MNKKSGFTLIELLLVLAIIGIISAIAIPAILGRGKRTQRVQEQQTYDAPKVDYRQHIGSSKDTLVSNLGYPTKRTEVDTNTFRYTYESKGASFIVKNDRVTSVE